jgi:crotonobetainyl-CoA:carnitine CoA-transferase CaiB-like acyl-CoA transferase
MDETPTRVRRPSPGLGEHTLSVLTELGIDEPILQRLLETGVIGRAPSS